jgi:hypothetical protein
MDVVEAETELVLRFPLMVGNGPPGRPPRLGVKLVQVLPEPAWRP